MPALADRQPIRANAAPSGVEPDPGYPEVIRELIEDLIAHEGGPAASVFVPTEVGGPQVEQNRIRLRNQLSRVEDMLEEMGWKPRPRQAYLAQAREQLEGEAFWKRGGHGLAVYIQPDGRSRDLVLGHPVTEGSIVADTFHIRPLLPGLDPAQVDVLVLTLGRVRLYRMTHHELVRREGADLPDSFEDVNWFVDREKQGQQHANARGEKGIRHGHDPSERRQADVERFLSAIDDALPGGPGSTPLVVLGVDDLVDRFLAIHGPAATAPHSGLWDADDLNLVRDKAMPVLAGLADERKAATVEHALAQLGRGNASVDLRAGLEAAVAGRVAELVLSAEASPVWGRFDPDSLRLERREVQSPGDVDLIDRLAVHSLRNGAELGVVDGRVGDHDWVAIARF